MLSMALFIWFREHRPEMAGGSDLAALARAVAEAPAVFKRLGLEEDLRETTRKAVTSLLPRLLGRPGLPVVVAFDDDPRGNG